MSELETLRRLAPPAEPPDAAAVARIRARAFRRSRPRRAWVLAPALAAAVLGVLAVFLPAGGGEQRAFAAAAVRAAEGSPRLLLEGWTVARVDEWNANIGEMTFAKDGRTLELSWFEERIAPVAKDGEEIVARGVALPGGAAVVYRYEGSNDYTAVWRAGDATVQARALAGSPDEFVAIVRGLEAVGAREWLGALPPSAVTPSEQRDVIDEMLVGVPLPPGFDRAALDSERTRDRYQLGARVAGAVACGWFASWVAGDERAKQRALAALASSRSWPVLLAMNAEGDYPEVLWQLADAAATGRDAPAGKPGISAADVYEAGLGC